MEPDAHHEFVREIDEELAAMDDRMRRLREVREYHAEKAGLSPRSNGFVVGPVIESFVGKINGRAYARTINKLQKDRFRGLSQRQAAETIIHEAGKPLRAGEIARTMIECGFPKPSKMSKLINSLFTTMTRDTQRFQKVGPGLWDLRTITAEENTVEEQGR